jgi:hypothetical protein
VAALELPFPPTPENAARFAALAVEAALRVGNVDLDYAPATLPRLGEFLAVHGRDHRDAAVLTFGCYLGEMFVRAGLGRWCATDETPMKGVTDVPLLIELGGASSGDLCNPLGRVRRFLEGGPDSDLVGFWQSFAGGGTGWKPWWRRDDDPEDSGSEQE